jgi:ribonuclease R
MKTFPLSGDPDRQAELARYDEPVASRTYIKQVLQSLGRPATYEELCAAFELDDEALREKLLYRLKAMTRDGELVLDRKERFGIPEHMNLRRGRVIGHPDGFGFVCLEGGGEDWYLPPKEMRRLLPDDKVLVHVRDVRKNGRVEASVVRILEEGKRRIVGILEKDGALMYVVPQDKAIAFDVQVDLERSVRAEPGELVVVELDKRPARHTPALGHIVERLGAPMAPGMEIAVALRSFDLPFEWPADVVEQAEKIPAEVMPKDAEGRVDLRDLPLVTIDGEDARDFDDALYCKKRIGGGWTLWVAIADVSHYVRPGEPLDREARERGNSVYFPGEVIPMLPEKLSNGLCSLNPQVERLAMVCQMKVSRRGKVTDHQFYPARIRSHARLTYNQVWAFLSGDKSPEQALGPYAARAEDLKCLYGLYQQFAAQRARRGAMEFDTIETKFVFDDNRKIQSIVPVKRNDAHKIVEECMIAANVAAAEFVDKHLPAGMYRNHAGPSETRLAAFREYLGMLGLSLGGRDEPTPSDYRKLMEQVAGREDAEQIQTMALRSLSQAVYGPINVGHFGLALKSYAHFTSPIRRYPDLVLHRLIKAILSRGKALAGVESGVQYSEEQLAAFADHCSLTERRADQATRDVDDWLRCEFMLDKVGETFDGKITGVASFGVFVRLTSQFVEGLVHVSSLPADYYHFDTVRQTLVGERTRAKFAIGQTVKVKVNRVDLEARKIDFELIDAKGATRRRSPRGNSAANKPRGSAGERKSKGRSTGKASASSAKRSEHKGAAAKKGASRGKGSKR